MKNSIVRTGLVLLLGIGFNPFAFADSPQGSDSANTTRRELQFDNEQLKVWKTIILPDQPLSLHRHDNDRALIVLKGGDVEVVNEEGKKTNTYHWESGKAYWLKADPEGLEHGDKNVSKQPIEVIVVELKKVQ